MGDSIELAPRDPDPTASYTWRIARAPDGSRVSLGSDPVEHLEPDAPGHYVVELDAPDGTHELTVRAFPGPLGVGGGEGASGVSGVSGQSGGRSGQSGGRSGISGGSGSGRIGESDASGAGGRPRVSLSTTVTDDEVVVRADPQPHPDGDETAEDLDVEFLLDDRDDLTMEDVTVAGRELTVPLDRLGDRLRVHAVSVGRHGYSVPDAVDITRDGDDEAPVTVRRPYDAPDWADDAVIYEIYVRTFPGQDTDAEGAVFDAIREKLDYIEGLGVDTLWLTPVLENDHAPHGYNITDFFSLAEDLGTREEYEALVEAAHDRGMSVLFDLICNHSARDHPYFQAAVSDPENEYRDWYEWRGPTEPETYFEWEYIANFNFDNLKVRRHLLDAVDKWAPLVDGFRCDMAWAVPDAFWRELHDRLKARDSEFLLLDETIPYIPDFQAGCFDVHFDSTTYAALRRIGNGESADVLVDAIEERTATGFPDHAGFMLYAENHDETRYIVECGRPEAEAALGALFTLPGSPMVYAGQEFGQRGQRDDLAWEHVDEALQSHVEELAALRTDQSALTAGADLRRTDYEVREGWDDRVVAFVREGDADAVAVVLNFGEEPATVAVDAAAGSTDLLSGDGVGDGGELTVESVAVVPADGSR